MEGTEISINKVPQKVFHIVSKRMFDTFIDENETYDPRFQEEFGGNAPYVHTSPTLKQMNVYIPLLEQLQDKEFYLLTIDVEKLSPEKVKYIEFDTRRYYHFWCAIPKEAYTKRLLIKDSEGKILF